MHSNIHLQLFRRNSHFVARRVVYLVNLCNIENYTMCYLVNGVCITMFPDLEPPMKLGNTETRLHGHVHTSVTVDKFVFNADTNVHTLPMSL